MGKISTASSARQPSSLFDSLSSERAPKVVAVGEPLARSPEDSRLVTRGYLLQSASLPSSEVTQGVLIDWLGFTIPVVDADSIGGVVYELKQLFGGGEYSDKGWNGYTRTARILGGKGWIVWHPERVEMGVHVELPSTALRIMEQQDGILSSVADFLGWIVHRDGKFTRLDTAIDTDKVTMERVAAAVGAELVTQCTSAREIKGLRGDLGWTVYIGSPKSDRQVRFYNKAAEQGLGAAVWTRCEIQHRARHAQVAAQAIIDGTLDPVSLFNSACDFRDPASDTNVSRRTRSDWWSDWLGSLTEKVSFAFVAPDKGVKQSAEWVTTQVGTTLAMLAVADPENFRSWLLSVAEKGFGKLDDFRRQKAVKFRDMGFSLA